MPHGITQCHLPPGRGDIPALTPAEDERVCLHVCVFLSAIVSSELHARSSPTFYARYLWPWLGPPLAA